MAPAEFFPVAVDIATAINDLHKAGLAHCWLTTSAFTIDSQTGNACLTDYAFGMGTPFYRPCGQFRKGPDSHPR